MARTARGACAAAFTMGFLAVGCGGGGGGGDPATEVHVEGFSPTTLGGQSFYGAESAYTAEITVHLGGPLEALNGRAIYAYASSDDDLFIEAKVPEGGVDVYERTARVVVSTAKGIAPKRYQGTLHISGCLDPQCQAKLGNTPIDVAYDFTILPSLSLGQSALSRTADFGTRPATVRVPVTLPQGTTTWDVVRNDSHQGGNPDYKVVALKAPDGSANVDVEFHLRTSGAADYHYYVTASAANPNGSGWAIPFSVPLDVHYSVTSTGKPVAMVPASASLAIPFGTHDDTFDSFEWEQDVALNPVCHEGERVVDSIPPAAVGNPMTNWDQWYSMTAVKICGSFSGEWECLPAGSYVARTVQRCAVGTTEFTAQHTLNLTITAPQ